MYLPRLHTGLVHSAIVLLALVTLSLPSSAASFAATVLLDGSQEVPPVITPATGESFVTYDSDSNELIYNLSYSGLIAPSTAAHFHTGAPGVAGPVVLPIPITLGVTSESLGPISATLTEADEADLLAGLWYLNVHSDPALGGVASGEIRGQVVLEQVAEIPEPATVALTALGLAAVALRSRRLIARVK